MRISKYENESPMYYNGASIDYYTTEDIEIFEDIVERNANIKVLEEKFDLLLTRLGNEPEN